MSDTTAKGSSTVVVTDLSEVSCRIPLFALFTGAAFWLVISSILNLLSSIKFHSPDFLASPAWLTYGRVYPASTNALIYGFAIPAGLALGIWMIAKIGRAPLSGPATVIFGAVLWNLGVAAGVLGILTGDASGFENFEFPLYSAGPMFAGYALVAIPAILTLGKRTERRLFVSQWFVLAALFWFPWIYSIANLLLLVAPVRGMAQAVIAWWYSANLLLVWLGLVGLALGFYFLPRLTQRELDSHYLAVFVFWILLLFGSWTGVPATAPVPAWLPIVSTVARVLVLLSVVAVFLVVHYTLGGDYRLLVRENSLRFAAFGFTAFGLAQIISALQSLAGGGGLLSLSWLSPARFQLATFGFYSMMVFAGVYFVLPRIAAATLALPRLARLHFWLAAAGVMLVVIPLAVAGFVQSSKFANPSVPVVDVAKATLPFLRASTMGELLILLGNLALFFNVLLTVIGFFRRQVQAGLSSMRAEVGCEGAKA